MTTKKYFYDPTAETLTVVEFNESGEIVGISELSEPYVLQETGKSYPTLNKLSRGIGAGVENAWQNWHFTGPDGKRALIGTLRK